ncbi:SSrecog-domain-containing protein [Punctularia strigosozonata HHB-11173 SS5]|uniref:SSrecog-domain-containing protein n=1 Tax=Punctularia strigosozonata (strain HHB-11173) TaxID=741275 RepID=UPI0004417098|nr:SSrecog-domain-containing protein [Punctularia strigosozonata HHB-11173 SS5]EIN12861.1 SSrecog-domain-containing protein [Punctularia strigosozonata HHB-11173 SS5]
MTTQFEGIFHGLTAQDGKFRVAAAGMAWKADGKESTTTMMKAEDIKWAQWLRVARNFQLRIGLKDRRRETFDGFVREDHDRLAALLKQHFGVVLETKDVSFKGWNWGVTDFQGEDLAFLVSNKTSFELPLNHVANSNIAGRTEVSLEFANLPTPSKKADELVEIRFYVPGTHTKTRGSDAGSQQSENEEEDGEEISAAQAFHDAIKEKAEIGQVAGDIILGFEEVLVLTPRGRYDVDMFPEFLRLRGKTYDYKIIYTTIQRMFLLPKDDQHVLFIVSQTRYQYLVMQFNREEEITAELNLSEEEIAKYDRLKKNYEDPTFEVVSGVFRALSGKKIIGVGTFQSRHGHPGIKCNLKAIQGDLFMLEKYVFFVSKSPMLIEISDIHQVVFSRVGSGMGATAARTFDLKIVTKSGPEYTFTAINKDEHEPTEAFLKDKKVRVKNEMMQDVDMLLGPPGVDDEDEEMQSVASSDEEAPKPRLGGDDDDSEEDEDFQASDTDAGSPTDTSDDSDGAKTASDASGDLDMAKAQKPKKKKLVKKKVKSDAATKESDAEDDERPKKAAPKPKPKPKKKDTDDQNAMYVDDDEPKPKSKAADEEGPAKKKIKKSND